LGFLQQSARLGLTLASPLGSGRPVAFEALLHELVLLSGCAQGVQRENFFGSNRVMKFRYLFCCALLAPAIITAFFLARVNSAEEPVRECTLLSESPEDGTPLAATLNAAASTVEPSRQEATCRAALRTDPANPTFAFQLARALTLEKKPLEAMKYYLDAADRGHAGAMNDLGGVFEYGVGVPKNLTTAIVWYERAAELGHAGAMSHLGQLIENGIGTPQDLAKAKRWYEKAAMLGNAGSMNNLANLFRRDGDASAAAHWYLKAAQLGLASAMNSIAELSEVGLGVPQNFGAAKYWYTKAADLGNADAMGNLGALFEGGRGEQPNLEIARQWYIKGANLNGRLAMHHLGALFETGRGVPKNLSEAKLLYERAAALGYSPALNDLGRLHLVGVAVPKNYIKAKNLFEQAAAYGDADAMNNLGILYLDGKGVGRDISIARMWFERAIALNNREAQENLRRLEEVAGMDPAQIAERRTSCIQSCAELHRLYVGSVCDHYAPADNGEKPERTKCIEMTLTVSKQCRDSCREWAPTRQSENTCLTCFQGFLLCTTSREAPDKQGEADPLDSKSCLASVANCRATARPDRSESGFPKASEGASLTH